MVKTNEIYGKIKVVEYISVCIILIISFVLCFVIGFSNYAIHMLFSIAIIFLCVLNANYHKVVKFIGMIFSLILNYSPIIVISKLLTMPLFFSKQSIQDFYILILSIPLFFSVVLIICFLIEYFIEKKKTN